MRELDLDDKWPLAGMDKLSGNFSDEPASDPNQLHIIVWAPAAGENDYAMTAADLMCGSLC